VSGEYRTLVERWDGAEWSREISQSPGSTEGMLLDAVACASGTSCVAVGDFANALDVPQPMALNLSDEGWLTTLTEFTGEPSALLNSIACPSPSACWAVGYDTARTRPLIARWNGQEWSPVVAPTDPTSRAEGLYGVGCASPSECWAVGWSVRSDGFRALIEHWDGTEWQTVEPPSLLPVSGGDRTGSDARASANGSRRHPVEGVDASSEWLRGVACASSDECWAVGVHRDAQAVVRPVIMRWDGSSWSVAVNGAPGQADAYLSGVTCGAPGDCWAVGAHYGNVSTRVLIQHWDGSAWTESVVTDAGTTSFDILNAVTCPSVSDCWAVGSTASEGKIRPLAVRWDGSSWSQVPSPSTDAVTSVLRGISCLDSELCWAFGQRGGRTLLQSWDGQIWRDFSPPTFGRSATLDALVGIACVRNSANCHAVGYWSDVHQLHTLAAHYSAPTPG
jgi:hypothetical protein